MAESTQLYFFTKIVMNCAFRNLDIITMWTQVQVHVVSDIMYWELMTLLTLPFTNDASKW